MRKTEQRSILREEEWIVGWECDVCGMKAHGELFPEEWCVVTENIDFQQLHVCSPPCLFKLLSGLDVCDISMHDMSKAFYKRIVEYTKPLFARGELDPE